MKLTTISRLAAFALLLPFMTACDKDSSGVEDEDRPAFIRLTLGSQTSVINSSGVVTSGTLTIPTGATTLSAQFLNAQNQVMTPESGSELEVIMGSGGRITFARTGPFSGTLTGVSAGAQTVNVGLKHGSHYDFGPFPLSFTVTGGLN